MSGGQHYVPLDGLQANSQGSLQLFVLCALAHTRGPEGTPQAISTAATVAQATSSIPACRVTHACARARERIRPPLNPASFMPTGSRPHTFTAHEQAYILLPHKRTYCTPANEQAHAPACGLRLWPAAWCGADHAPGRMRLKYCSWTAAGLTGWAAAARPLVCPIAHSMRQPTLACRRHSAKQGGCNGCRTYLQP